MWEEGSAYAELQCRVESVRPRANISWQVVDREDTGGHDIDSVVELLVGEDESKSEEEAVDVEVLNVNVSVRSALRLPLAQHQGKTVVCVVRHRSLKSPERREVQLAAPGEFTHVSIYQLKS